MGRAARGKVFGVADSPSRDVALVFGAGVRPDGSLTAPLEDRVLTAVSLYRSGKVRKLLMSGDNGRDSYDEPTAMMEYAVAHGVREVRIVKGSDPEIVTRVFAGEEIGTSVIAGGRT